LTAERAGSIMFRYGLDDRAIEVRSPTEAKDFSSIKYEKIFLPDECLLAFKNDSAPWSYIVECIKNYLINSLHRILEMLKVT
jgi:hypothetical protein